MSIKSIVSKTCVWCVVTITALLTLLAITWVVILANNQ